MDIIKDKKFTDLPEEPLKEGTGLALIISTEKISALLYDLKSGKCLGEAHDDNGLSVIFKDAGEEEMTDYAASSIENGLRLTSLIREKVYDIADTLSKECGRGALEVRYITVAGTALTEHLYAAMPVFTLKGPEGMPLSEFGEEILAVPSVYYFPLKGKKVNGIENAAMLAERCGFSGGMAEKALIGAALCLSQLYRKKAAEL